MQFNVPQFIDIEDRIVGPLTAKQLGWLALGGFILLIIWNFLDFTAFILAAIFIVTLSVGLAFFKPQGMSLFSFLASSIFFMTKPKVYIWKRSPKKNKLEKRPQKKPVAMAPKRALKKESVEKISQLLDQ